MAHTHIIVLSLPSLLPDAFGNFEADSGDTALSLKVTRGYRSV